MKSLSIPSSREGLGNLKSELYNILRWAYNGVDNQYSLVLFRTDGLVIASIPEFRDEDLDLGSIIYGLVACLQKLAYSVGMDDMRSLILVGSRTSMAIVIKDNIGIMAISDRKMNLGLILLQLEMTINKCLEVLSYD